MKSIIASGLLLGMAHGAAIAGPYANVESKLLVYWLRLQRSVIEAHVGYEGDGPLVIFKAVPAFNP